MKKVISVALMLLCCMILMPTAGNTVQAAEDIAAGATGNIGWQTKDGKKYYFNKKGVMLTGWQKIKGKWYKFKKNGVYTGTVKKKTIVLDPGHSGVVAGGTEALGPGTNVQKSKDTTGTQGVATGVPEYKLTLTISKKLKKELESRGYRVVMTRTNHKKPLSCIQRAKIANRTKADAYIRIHANGSSNQSTKGAMTICTTSASPYISKKLAKKNIKLSTVLLDEYIKATGTKKEFVWQTDSMSGNNWSKVPTTIIEMGYMSNAKEDKKMQKASYQKKMVKGIANGIDAYFE